MKTLLTLFVLLTSIVTVPSYAAEAESCENAINVKVNGLVCDFCARALEKVFAKREGVSDIEVDLDSGIVKIAMKPGESIDDKTLKQLVSDSGYDISAIERGC